MSLQPSKQKLTQQQIELYLQELKRHIQERLPDKSIVTDSDVYENYPQAVSKKTWSDIARKTHLERTKIYKHYTFTFTRKFHPEIIGDVQNQLNRLITEYVDHNKDIDSRKILKVVWDYQLKYHYNLHHDAVDQYIRYFLRKNYSNYEINTLSSGDNLNLNQGLKEKDSPKKPIEQDEDEENQETTRESEGTFNEPLSILAKMLQQL